MRAKLAQMPLAALLGGGLEPVAAYASGGYYRPGDPVENVRNELARYAAEGFTDFKIKVGGAPPDVDVARVRAARETVGTNARIALDANNAWASIHDALRFVQRVAKFDPWWIEEPFSPDDVAAHRRLRTAVSIPIATGEIHATRWDFRALIDGEACDILQPDAGVVGGISEWLVVANAARLFDVPVAPHWNANVHVHLVAATDALAVEYFAPREGIFNFEELIQERLAVRGGRLEVPRGPGLGFTFDPDAIERYRV